MRHVTVVLAAAAIATTTAGAARAQRIDPRPSRFSFGVDAVVMNPRGAFGRNVDNGFGVGGHLLVRLDPRGIFALRADAATTQYGSERQRAGSTPYNPYFPGRVGLDVITRNSVAWLGIGPELSVPIGPVRPYVNAAVGYARFSTVSSLEGGGYHEYDGNVSRREIASTENQGDGVTTRSAGAGVYLTVGPRRWLARAHLGARYHDGGEASYLREGSITDNPDGTITFDPLRSRTPFVTYQGGITVAFPTRRR